MRSDARSRVICYTPMPLDLALSDSLKIVLQNINRAYEDYRQASIARQEAQDARDLLPAPDGQFGFRAALRAESNAMAAYRMALRELARLHRRAGLHRQAKRFPESEST